MGLLGSNVKDGKTFTAFLVISVNVRGRLYQRSAAPHFGLSPPCVAGFFSWSSALTEAAVARQPVRLTVRSDVSLRCFVFTACVISRRPPSHPSLPETEGAEGAEEVQEGARGRVIQGEERGQRLSQVPPCLCTRPETNTGVSSQKVIPTFPTLQLLVQNVAGAGAATKGGGGSIVWGLWVPLPAASPASPQWSSAVKRASCSSGWSPAREEEAEMNPFTLSDRCAQHFNISSF